MRRTSAIALAAALLLATLTMSTAALAQSGLRTEGDAVSARGLYQAEVPVNGQGEEERQDCRHHLLLRSRRSEASTSRRSSGRSWR